MRLKIFIIILILYNIDETFCQQSTPWIDSNTKYETIESRFPPPLGYKRIQVNVHSFANWLRNMPVLPTGEPVKDYKNNIKVSSEDTTLASIIAYSIRGKKLEQCMDIIIRWRAEYLYANNLHDQISFYLPGSFPLKWSNWKKGYRPVYSGINVNMLMKENPDSSRDCFEKYLWEIFYHSYTQTAFFSYSKIEPDNLQIGDFIVKKGRKGHAVLIVDLAKDENDNKIALIGHGDTPARQFYILNYQKNNPWFPIDFSNETLPLPFKKKMFWHGLRRF